VWSFTLAKAIVSPTLEFTEFILSWLPSPY
jgi:hypothetical protein